MKSRFPLAILAGIICLGLALIRPVSSPVDNPYETGKTSFQVSVNGELNLYNVLGVFVLPGQAVDLSVYQQSNSEFTLESPGDEACENGPTSWTWVAPEEPGMYPLKVTRMDLGEVMKLNLFVLEPVQELKNGRLQSYRIGNYPNQPLHGLDSYIAPEGFIRVNRNMGSIKVSPHFTLDQFLCKQDAGYPKYLVLKERLLLKLEYLLERANDRGLRANTFHVMSGYRTPWYNRAIGRRTTYSRHIYGDAADIFIDSYPKDGIMDDLTGDGRVNFQDTKKLAEIVETAVDRPEYETFIGGLGKYKSNRRHGPFIHVDTRGHLARW